MFVVNGFSKSGYFLISSQKASKRNKDACDQETRQLESRRSWNERTVWVICREEFIAVTWVFDVYDFACC